MERLSPLHLLFEKILAQARQKEQEKRLNWKGKAIATIKQEQTDDEVSM